MISAFRCMFKSAYHPSTVAKKLAFRCAAKCTFPSTFCLARHTYPELVWKSCLVGKEYCYPVASATSIRSLLHTKAAADRESNCCEWLWENVEGQVGDVIILFFKHLEMATFREKTEFLKNSAPHFLFVWYHLLKNLWTSVSAALTLKYYQAWLGELMSSQQNK